MNGKLLKLLALGTVFASMTANASLHISPSTDPGNVMVGDTLDFTVSIDSIAPPAGDTWDELNLDSFRIFGPTSDFNFDGTCSDLSGLFDANFSCTAGGDGAFWTWNSLPDNSSSVSGNLFSFEGLFSEVGTYSVFLQVANAGFLTPSGGFVIEPIGFGFTQTDPILIHVSEASAPEPATLTLIGLGLAGLGFSRRRKRS